MLSDVGHTMLWLWERRNFRILCDFSYAAADDPIMKSGFPGESYLHLFFGNTKTNAFSTTE